MAEKKKSKKTQRRVDDLLLYLSVISVLTNSNPLYFNDVDVSQSIRLAAIDYELTNLANAIGITIDKFGQYANDLEWSETSPEQREFNNALTQGTLKILSMAQTNESE